MNGLAVAAKDLGLRTWPVMLLVAIPSSITIGSSRGRPGDRVSTLSI
jgi:hypothetical protein